MAFANLQKMGDREGIRQCVPVSTGRNAPRCRDEIILDLCERMLDLVAELFNVSGRELRSPGRSSVAVSRVRQVAMYVTHVALQLNMGEVGKGFGRDRTTVVHACHLIEDMRDDPDFDQLVAAVERTAARFLVCEGDGAHD